MNKFKSLIIITLFSISHLFSEDINEQAVNQELNAHLLEEQQIETTETDSSEANIDSSELDTLTETSETLTSDTVKTQNITVNDSTNQKIDDSASISTTISDSSKQIENDTTEESVTDTIKSWKKRSFNIGVGWGIGKEPLFLKWNGYNSDIVNLYKDIFKDDSLKVSSKVIEEPPTYNVTFPIRLSFSLPEKKGYRLTPILTYTAIKREYSSRINETIIDTIDGVPIDTSLEIFHINRKQCLRDISLGLRVSRFISDKYFIINGVEDVTINLGAYISPFVGLCSKTKIKGSAITDSSFNYKAFGLGANWEVGLSTYKTTPAGNGIEVGLSYFGGFRGQFVKEGYIQGSSPTNNDIGGSFVGNNNNLNYLTHKLLVFVDLILTKKEKRNRDDKDDEIKENTKQDKNAGQEQ